MNFKEESLLKLNTAFDEALNTAGALFAETVERLVRQRTEALNTINRLDAQVKEWEL